LAAQSRLESCVFMSVLIGTLAQKS